MAKRTDQEASKPPKADASEPHAASPTVAETPARRRKAAAKPGAKKGKKVDKSTTTAKKSPVKAKQKPAKAGPEVPPGKKTPAKGKRNSHATRPTAAEKAKILERQTLTYHLRKHYSVRKVVEHLKSKGIETSVGTVQRDWEATLKMRREELEHNVTDWITLELDSLQDAQAQVEIRIRKFGKAEDVKALIAIQQQRDRYLNLSKAQQSENNVRSNLAALLGVPVEELPDVGSDSPK